jgi:hypothetical protein
MDCWIADKVQAATLSAGPKGVLRLARGAASCTLFHVPGRG